jgi:hypothetical protein
MIFHVIYFFLIFVSVAYADQNAFAPEPGKTLLFIGQDSDTIAHYVSETGIAPSGTMFYTSVQEATGLGVATEYGTGQQYGDGLLHFSDSVIQVGLYMAGGLEKTIAGMYDANLFKLAKWIKKAGRPVYLRIGYEFDDPTKHYDPQLYIQAFHHVVDFLRTQGVANAAYVWHSYGWTQKEGQQWMDWYPGDEYVDWFGVTIFNVPSQIWNAQSFLKLARAHGKPFMICESSPEGMYTLQGKKDWYKHIFQFIKDQNVEAFCYINSNWDVIPMFKNQHWGDARIEAIPEIKELWLNEISQDRYLKASPDLFQSLGWQKG